MNATFIVSLIVAVLLVGVMLWSPWSNAPQEARAEVTLFTSPSCGCCVNYATYLRRNGFTVNVEKTNNIATIKEKHGIPENMESCHTVVMDDHFVEGHVPIEAVNALSEYDSDAVRGIALPGMPAGSPGMTGAKQEEFTVFQKGPSGEWNTFMEL